MELVHNNQKLKERRRELRKRLTKTEEILWLKIRNNKLEFKFKRQHSIGGYILDFYCSESKLIIEIDGESHSGSDAIEYDNNRDRYFEELGYSTIRFLNSEVENNILNVIEKIKKCLASSPLLHKERGKG
jgi:leucyl-tRNA synthetase